MTVQVGTSATLTWTDVDTLWPNALKGRLQQDPWNKINSLILELNQNNQVRFWQGNKLANCIKEIALPTPLVQRIKHALKEKGIFRKLQAEAFIRNQSKINYSIERSFAEGHDADVLWQARAPGGCRITPNSPQATPLFKFLCTQITQIDTSLYQTIGKLIADGANLDEQHPEKKTIPFDDFISNGGNIAVLFAGIQDQHFRQRADSYLDADLREIGAALPGETFIAMSDLSVRLSWMQAMIQHNTTELLTGTRLVALAQFIESSYRMHASAFPSGEPGLDQLAEAARQQLTLAADLLAKIPAQQQDFLNALSPNFRRYFATIYLERHDGLANEKQQAVGKLYALYREHLGQLSTEQSNQLGAFFKLSTKNKTMQVTRETLRQLGVSPNSNKIAQVLSEILSLARYLNVWLQQDDLARAIACLKEISTVKVRQYSKAALENNSQQVDIALTNGELTRLKYQTLQKMLSNLEPKGLKWEEIDQKYPQVDLDSLEEKIFDGFKAETLAPMPDKKNAPADYEHWALEVGNRLEQHAQASNSEFTTLREFLLAHFPVIETAPPPRSAVKRGFDDTDLQNDPVLKRKN